MKGTGSRATAVCGALFFQDFRQPAFIPGERNEYDRFFRPFRMGDTVMERRAVIGKSRESAGEKKGLYRIQMEYRIIKEEWFADLCIQGDTDERQNT